MNESLDLLDEKRENAYLRIAEYKRRIEKYYNKSVRPRRFEPGEWVLRRVFQNTQETNVGKLAPHWEGPYVITQEVGKGAYKLRTEEGRDINKSWNAAHLMKYHF